MLAASLTLSYCEGGNIPGGENLTFAGDGLTVRNLAASGGAGQETAAQAQARLLRELNTTRKCVSAGDYERLARETPGLRVAAAKALPAFDPEEPTGGEPSAHRDGGGGAAGAGKRPLPDRRFLAAVQARLDRLRPIGTRVKVIPPVYVELTVRVSLRGRGRSGADPGGGAALLPEGCGIGGVLRAGDIAALVQAAPGVLQVRRVDLRTPRRAAIRTRTGTSVCPARPSRG